MKKNIFYLLCFLMSTFASAQQCSKSDFESAYASVISHELNHHQGYLDLKIKLTGEDSTTLIGWSFSDSFFTASLLHGFSKSLIDSSDTASIYFNLSYDSSQLPYYPKEIVFQIKAINRYGDTFSTIISAVVYFTLYGSTEIWDMEDFNLLPRKWLPKIDPEPARVYIAPSSIPTSTRPSLDSLNILYEWQNEFALKTVENLPYAIEIAAYHPDSIAYNVHLDSTEIDTETLSKRQLLPQKFSGVISGKLEFNYINDNEDSVIMPLAGVRLKLVESDPMGRIANTLFTSTHTDINGNFNLIYDDIWQRGGEGDEIELVIRIESKNKNYNIKVIRKEMYAANRVLNIVKEDILFALDPVGKNANVNLGTISIDNQFTNEETKNYYKICNWAFMGYEFLENQVHPNFMWRDLEIAFQKNHSDDFITTLGKGRIRLMPEDRNHESTIWHEFGHFVMDRGMGMALMKGVSGKHTNSEEHNFHLAWSEGWATGFSGMLDVFYNTVDGESGLRRGRANVEWRFPTLLNTTGIGNGIRSEYHIACAINDLYDGATYFENNTTNSQRWNDDETLIGSEGNGYDAGQTDNVSLSANDIVLALEDQPKSIGEYYAVLMRLYSDCNTRKEIKLIFDQNRVVLNSANLHVNNDNEFSSDAVDIIHDMEEHLGFLNNIYTSFRTDVVELNDNFQSFNLGTETGKLTKNVSDNLVINNTGTLFFNRNDQIGFETNGWYGSNVLSNSHLTANVCADRIDVTNNGSIEIGDINGSTTSTTLLLSGSQLALSTTNSNQNPILRINNNSKLIIEEGATLHIFPDSRIILNGDNAILEIKGIINVHDNATFSFEGGTAGSGHVVFNTTHKNNIVLGNNSRIRFVGANNNDRVMEVPAGAVFWPDNVQVAGNVQSTFEITDGFVALGNNALINIGTRVNLNRVRFYAESTFPARSICLWGQKHKIENISVENVSEGIRSFNTFGGNQLILKNVSVSGALSALFSEGKGSTLLNFESINNTTGIEIKASTGRNIFHSPKVNGALTYATKYTGYSSSNLVINKADYFDNINGVSFTGGGTLVLNCGRIHNILPSYSNGNGIKIKSGTIILADALGYKAGRVSFLNNKNTIILNNTKHYLNNGNNDLSFKTGSGNLALLGSSSHIVPTGGIIRADNNLWDGTNVPTTLCSSPPGGYQNYNLRCKEKIGSLLVDQCVNIPTIPIINLIQFTTEQTNRCVNGSGSGNDIGTRVTSKLINTTHFTEANLQLAVGTVIYNMYNVQDPDYPYIINLWAELLTEVSYTSPYSEEDHYYINLIENKMMEALGTYLSNDTTLLQSQPGLPHFETVTDVQNEWIEALDEDTSSLATELKNLFNFDKGITYHLQGETEEAQMQWSAMQNWANIEYLEHTDYWLCQLQREIAIKYCGKNPDSINQFPQCQYYEEGNNAIYGPINTNEKNNKPQADHNIKENKISKQLILYPNPAKTTVTAVLETSQKDFATINIYTIDGKCLKTIKQIKLSLGLNKINISLADVPVGYYTISIQSRNINWNEKIIIE